MKKILCLFSALSLVLISSCSSDDSSSNESSILIKKIVEIDNDNTTFTVEYTYDGKKLIKEVGKEEGYSNVINYTYNGDLITKMSETDDDGLISTTELTYDGNKLKTMLVTEKNSNGTYINKTTYTHNSDGSVSYSRVSVDPVTKEESNTVLGKLTYTSGNLVKEESGTGLSLMTIVYEYDTKNNPYKNVTGAELLLDNSEIGYSKHNKIKETTASAYSDRVSSSTFIYDGNDFPTESKSFDKTGKLEGTTQFFY